MSEDLDNLDDFLDLLESDVNENVQEASESVPPSSSSSSPNRKALQDLTYEDLFGSPEKKKARKDEDNVSSNKMESCRNSVMSQLGSKPVQPSVVKNLNSSAGFQGFDTSDLIIDHFSKLRIFKTSIALYNDEETSIESALKERNFGLFHVNLLNFPFWFRTKGAEIKNFWTSGVLVRKQAGIRKSAKGNEYCIWEVNDLKQLDKCWTIFLFSSAITAPSLSTIRVGSVVDIITPTILDSNKAEASSSGSIKFSINNSNQIRLVGTSKDFGFCQSKRKDGKDCTAVVNKWECATCIHHAASELKKINSSGGKKQRKNGVSFGQGTLFDRPPPSNNSKGDGIFTVNFGKPSSSAAAAAAKTKLNSMPINMPNKGYARMELQGTSVCNEVKRNSLNIGNANSISFKKDRNEQFGTLLKDVPKIITRPVLDLNPSKTRHLTEKDRMLLTVLSSPTKMDKGKESSTDKDEKKAKNGLYCTAEMASRIAVNPTAGTRNYMKYLNVHDQQQESTGSEKSLYNTSKKEAEPVTMTRETLKNMKKALDFVKLNGPLKKANPNAVAKRKSVPSNSKSSSASSATGSRLEVEFDFGSDDFKKILNAKSAHDEHTTELAQGEYFDKLVKKEAIENKLLNTYSIATNAVMCKQCKYVALSQSEFCKELQHNIRVVKATKRFFKCKDCNNRTMSLDRLPKHPCKQCNSSNWLAAPVGKEKTGPILPSEVLSVRGNEEKFIGSSGSQMFLNLEVS